MTDDSNGAPHMNAASLNMEERQKAEGLRQQALDALNQNRQQREHDEHGVGQTVAGYSYPWLVRPTEAALAMEELDFAFGWALHNTRNGSVLETASALLRVSTDRLRRDVKGTRWSEYARESRKGKSNGPVNGAVHAQWVGDELRVAIKTYGEEISVRTGITQHGDFMVGIRFDERNKRRDEIVKMAKEIVKRGG